MKIQFEKTRERARIANANVTRVRIYMVESVGGVRVRRNVIMYIPDRVWHFTWFVRQSETSNIYSMSGDKTWKNAAQAHFHCYFTEHCQVQFSLSFGLRALSLSLFLTLYFPSALHSSCWFRRFSVAFISFSALKTGEWKLVLVHASVYVVANIRNAWFHSHAQNTHFPFFACSMFSVFPSVHSIHPPHCEMYARIQTHLENPSNTTILITMISLCT